MKFVYSSVLGYAPECRQYLLYYSRNAQGYIKFFMFAYCYKLSYYNHSYIHTYIYTLAYLHVCLFYNISKMFYNIVYSYIYIMYICTLWFFPSTALCLCSLQLIQFCCTIGFHFSLGS